MTATTREIAEKVWLQTEEYEEEKSIAAITTALEQCEREGYLRGIEDSIECICRRKFFVKVKELDEYPMEVDTADRITAELRALAQKDVKP